jgi:four helix bundle protein
MGARDFKDLVVWQLSMELLQIVIAITDREPARTDRDYCYQLRKAARSVSSNLAEGFGRYSASEFARFIDISRASLKEVDSLLQEARLRNFASAGELTAAERLLVRIGTGTASLKQYLRSKRHTRLNSVGS